LIERYLQQHISKNNFYEQVQNLGTAFPAGSIVCVLTTVKDKHLTDSGSTELLKLLQEFRKDIKYHLRLGTLDSLHHILFGSQLLSIFKVREKTTISNETFINMLLNSFNEIHRSYRPSYLRSFISN